MPARGRTFGINKAGIISSVPTYGPVLTCIMHPSLGRTRTGPVFAQCSHYSCKLHTKSRVIAVSHGPLDYLTIIGFLPKVCLRFQGPPIGFSNHLHVKYVTTRGALLARLLITHYEAISMRNRCAVCLGQRFEESLISDRVLIRGVWYRKDETAHLCI